MYRRAWSRALSGLACLVLIPHLIAVAATLREEAVAYRMQGYEAQQRGERDAALEWYQKAAALDPTYPTPLNDAGVILDEQGRLEDAERAYQAALAIDPNYLEAHANLGILYERMGQKEKAGFHWMKRFQFGAPDDPWRARAEERLIALGVLKPSPELKSPPELESAPEPELGSSPGVEDQRASRRRVASEEIQAHAQSLEDFHAVTEETSDWP